MLLKKHNHTKLIVTHDKKWDRSASHIKPIAYSKTKIKNWLNCRIEEIHEEDIGNFSHITFIDLISKKETPYLKYHLIKNKF